MITKKKIAGKPLATTTYVLISAISLVAAVFIGYYYLTHMKKAATERMDDRIFYLVLILFGTAASALIFGIMNSYASMKGITSGAEYKFTGPVVGVIITVLGGFMLPKSSTDQFLSVRLFDEERKPVKKGSITLSFPHYQREESVNDRGMAMFPEIPQDQLRNKIIIHAESDGYSSVTLDTLLSSFDPINISLSQSKIIRIKGVAKDAAERPVKDVEVTVDGTPFFAKTINDGSFEIAVDGYHFGDRITLVTSHAGYEDKMKDFQIQSGEINKIEFVLNPVKKIK